MDVKVLGPGCARCKKLHSEVQAVVGQLGLDATVTKVEDYPEIMKYNILATPALVIDGEVKVSGRVPDAAELTTLLASAAAKG